MTGPEQALLLPTARLSPQQVARVREHAEAIDRAILAGMHYRGVECRIDERDPDVIAAAAREVERAGWRLQVVPVMEQSRLRGGRQEVAGAILVLAPTPEARFAAEALLATSREALLTS